MSNDHSSQTVLASSEKEDNGLLIMSWNVAGLTSTLHRIKVDYGKGGGEDKRADAPSSEAVAAKSLHPFARYMGRHGADILCVQEHKIAHASLSSRTEPLQCSSLPGYESFWSCCTDRSKRGFNGVVTFCRAGLVKAATSQPFQNAALDDEGRCVMTDHDSFVLFNVYMPNSSGPRSMASKMKFLNALRQAMKQQRSRGRKVVLVGDLNVSSHPIDVHWKYRSLRINRIVAEVQQWRQRSTGVAEELQPPRWKLEIERHWHKITQALATMEALPTKTTNTRTGEKFDKFRVCVYQDLPPSKHKNREHSAEGTADNNGGSGRRCVYLGGHETTAEEALGHFNFSARTYYDEESEERVLVEEENTLSIDTLSEIMSKLVPENERELQWADLEFQQTVIANSPDAKGRKPSRSPAKQWLHKIITEDRMVDVFRHFYASAEGRYTCWNQYTNRRYENEGCRIDYTLVDESLLEHAVKGGDEQLRSCNCPTSSDGFWNTEEAALHAATASGAFEAAAFEGGGIAAPPQHALDSQFGSRHTGMIYTPPTYSDHIATSILFRPTIFPPPNLQLNERDAATKKAQPHKSQRSIAAFFSTPTAGAAPLSSSQSTQPFFKRSAPVPTPGERFGAIAPSQDTNTKMNVTTYEKPRRFSGTKRSFSANSVMRSESKQLSRASSTTALLANSDRNGGKRETGPTRKGKSQGSVPISAKKPKSSILSHFSVVPKDKK